MSSILNDVKHMLGILPENKSFDSDLIIFINGVFGTLTQLGVGPIEGFEIVDDTDEWADYFDDPRLNAVKSYIFFKVKLAFDPPPTGFHVAALERQVEELEFRLNSLVDYG